MKTLNNIKLYLLYYNFFHPFQTGKINLFKYRYDNSGFSYFNINLYIPFVEYENKSFLDKSSHQFNIKFDTCLDSYKSIYSLYFRFVILGFGLGFSRYNSFKK